MATIYLQPGEVFFGEGPNRVRTLLGSCVAITLFHPARALGGMCHFVLPRRTRGIGFLDARYGDEALDLLLELMHSSGTRPEDFHAWIHGGGNMFPDMEVRNGRLVGQQNVKMGFELVETHGFRLVGSDVGQNVYRHVTLQLPSGQVAVENNDLSGGVRHYG